MPRQARIDAAGALHHIIIRGIDRKVIFGDDRDREAFLERLARLLSETRTPCYAWALMSNHVHLLLRTGSVPMASIMRRLLTGYAVNFNRRHHRHGHLFQNRYKSILCEEDRYLRQLVAYIHLNPLRAGVVADMAEMKDYPYTGHSALMGRLERAWQDTEYVLAVFGRRVSEARGRLDRHMAKWAKKGSRPELTGGGLIRSAGGWSAVKEAYREGIRLASDERLLGSSEFVENTLREAGEVLDRRARLQSIGMGLSEVVGAVCRWSGIDETELTCATKRAAVAQARGLIGYLATREFSIPGTEVARRLHQDRSAVSRAVQRVSRNAELMRTANKILMRCRSKYVPQGTTYPQKASQPQDAAERTRA
jgi:REP element-mobilizing transposase RayT